MTKRVKIELSNSGSIVSNDILMGKIEIQVKQLLIYLIVFDMLDFGNQFSREEWS